MTWRTVRRKVRLSLNYLVGFLWNGIDVPPDEQWWYEARRG